MVTMEIADILALALVPAVLSPSAGRGPALPPELAVPVRHGVIFFCPDRPEDALAELVRLRADGFDLIAFASWPWTLPTPGSDVERRVRAVLDWCDREGVAFCLMHNIQWGGSIEGGLDTQVFDPGSAMKWLTDWARTLRGHPCVAGVILGNEIAPDLGKLEDAPRTWAAFRGWLLARHGSLADLNAAWRTAYASLDEVGPPPLDSPGWVDVRRFARECFAAYYRFLFDHAFRPTLGERLYGNKTSLDPFLHRACRGLTMTCWDDMVSQYPLWLIKCAADTTGKPMFNSELHLYNDDYAYAPSPERSRHRYYTSALLGEYMTASFAWGMWRKSDVAAIHAATPGILADLRQVVGRCRLLAAAYRQADVAALVTESNYYFPVGRVDTDYEASHPLARLNAYLSALGRPWRYLLDEDVAGFTGRALVIWSPGLRPSVARAILRLPASVRVIAVGAAAAADEYGRPLEGRLAAALGRRVTVVTPEGVAAAVRAAPGLPDAYRRVGTVSYMWWQPDRGNYQYDVPTCLLQAMSARAPDGVVVAVVNHTEEQTVAPLPWAEGRQVQDLLTGARLSADDCRQQVFGPLAIRLYLYR
jgi:hypothetical protein